MRAFSRISSPQIPRTNNWSFVLIPVKKKLITGKLENLSILAKTLPRVAYQLTITNNHIKSKNLKFSDHSLNMRVIQLALSEMPDLCQFSSPSHYLCTANDHIPYTMSSNRLQSPESCKRRTWRKHPSFCLESMLESVTYSNDINSLLQRIVTLINIHRVHNFTIKNDVILSAPSKIGAVSPVVGHSLITRAARVRSRVQA